MLDLELQSLQQTGGECMPIRITQDCVNCAACVDVCPNGGITQGRSVYVINQDLCTECVGFFSYQRCVEVCPIDCCIRNPKIILTEEALFERAKAIHANSGKHPTLTAETSHFRVGSGSKTQETSGSWWERLFGRKAPVST